MRTNLSADVQATILATLIQEYGGEPEDWTALRSFDRLCVKIEEVVPR